MTHSDPSPDTQQMERRRFLQSSLTVAWATPLILTLTASRAGAATCTPTNMPCSGCGTPCCPVPGDTALCCCSSPLIDDCSDPNQYCRSQADCLSQFPGGDVDNPDACWNDLPILGGGAATTTTMRSTGRKKLKYR